jgi:hypothetical protein
MDGHRQKSRARGDEGQALMPPIGPSNAPASTLIDVLGQVRDAFDAVGDATTIQIGGQYLREWGAGHGPRVLFVPEPPSGGGAIAKAQSLGYPASHVHACDVYVRADEETTDDLERFELLYDLSDRVVDFIATAASGRVEWGSCSDDSPLRTPSGLGAGLAFSFTYQRDINHDAARWKAAPRDVNGDVLTTPRTSPADTSAPTLPTSPAATSGDLDSITIAITTSE